MIHYCSECGSPNKSVNGQTVKFCGQCGEAVNKSFSTEYIKPKPKQRPVIAQEYEEEYEEEDNFQPIRPPKKIECELEDNRPPFRVPLDEAMKTGGSGIDRGPTKKRSKKARNEARQQIRQSVVLNRNAYTDEE